MQENASVPALASRFPPWAPWVLGGSFILIFMLRDYLLSVDGLIDHSAYWGRDFANVWTGGHLVREGRIDAIYDIEAYRAFQAALFGELGAHNYSYPPVTLPLATVLSYLPYGVALALWLGLTGALFAVAARPFWPDRSGPAVLAVLTPAALVNIWAGHYGFLVGALFLFGWRWLDDKPVRAGIMFGLMAVKPHLAILIPFVLLVRGDWRALISGAATVAALVLTTAVAFGPDIWRQYILVTSVAQAGMIDAGASFFRMMTPSFATAVLQLGGGPVAATAIQGVVSVLAFAAVISAARSRVPLPDLALFVATATFLVLPYAFNYDMTVVMIGALWVMRDPAVTDADYRLAWYGFVGPQAGMAAAIVGLPIMPLTVAALGIAQFRRLGITGGWRGLVPAKRR